MFSGIISQIGIVRKITHSGCSRVEIAVEKSIEDLQLGASISCSGVCLSVVELWQGRFTVEVTDETLACTTLGEWKKDTPVNLERSLRVGDELGGHFVFGHIDGVATVMKRSDKDNSARITIEAPPELTPMIAVKGSATLDGVSLTVNSVIGFEFEVNVIPHTLSATTLRFADQGAKLNLEVDPLARYVGRYQKVNNL